MDILCPIVSNIKARRDLAMLVRTHPVFYDLVIPRLYSRFELNWPGALGHPEIREESGSDALTRGLSTLCIGSSFARTVNRSRTIPGEQQHQQHRLPDNDFANGELLSILVAGAIRKMVNLETFVWDIPTGASSCIFEALSSLAHQPGNDCKLSNVWVRCDDNTMRRRLAGLPGHSAVFKRFNPGIHSMTYLGHLPRPHEDLPPPGGPVRYSEYHCEYPTFSVLPPLKRLTVTDVDELGYLDEMATFIGRSKETLEELTVRISEKASFQHFAEP
ncbi:uncharacterized protein C8A04DRAFT_29756 [Dichotomopilus funicola]|uniref:Uncharacterized protein n=1 Tax=Dichotomopilus funicola TaxID=1934379 RepID=A0AAN6ZMG2_9PEZI|nr:hypothetical protein C8A04DRAFT_29756 [Dichotomopilus funicola]